MREYTNMSWPGGPFGAEFRPFGKTSQMVAAFAVDFTAKQVPVAAAACYLRLRRGGAVPVTSETLNPGLFALAVMEESDPLRISGWLDRALVQARREAFVLAGHDFGATLAALAKLVDVPQPGIDPVAVAWAGDRFGHRQASLARLFETAADLRDPNALATQLSVPLGRDTPTVWPDSIEQQGDTAMRCLVRCTAIGLAAARETAAYTWASEGPLRVEQAVAHAVWDQFPPTVLPAVS